jgi:hypothetical protein
MEAKAGFIEHHEQWEGIFKTKKKLLGCVGCHDPHKSAKNADATLNPEKGIVTKCDDCHYQKTGKTKVDKHGTVPACIDCHMPKMAKSAVGDASKYQGDVRAHSFRINTNITAPQFTPDGKAAYNYITLPWACKQCHQTGGLASVKPDATLEATAKGYHQ